MLRLNVSPARSNLLSLVAVGCLELGCGGAEAPPAAGAELQGPRGEGDEPVSTGRGLQGVAPEGEAKGGKPRGGGAASPAEGKPGAELPPLLGAPAPVEPIGPPVPDDGEQTWVFDPSAVHTYELTLDPEVWAALQLNARDEEYAEANLVAAGRSLGSVGLRFKGSLGTLASCFADDGTPRCEKLSMKVKFDEYVEEQRFLGLKRINFNSMLFDDTLMHERLAYRVYREMGVVAPRSAHARLIINGEDWGVFSLVEDVDGRFTDHHFEGGDGNLYKEAWPGNADGDVLADALETNEEVADHSGFLDFQSSLLGAAPGELAGVLEQYLNVDTTLAYLAVDRALTNWDGVTAFYCYGDDYCENHNYFWYQDELEPRFVLIPWDLDNTFEASPLTGVPDLFEATADCTTIYEAMGRSLRASGCDPLLGGLVASDSARYSAQLDRLLEGPFAPGVLEGWIDELEAQLTPEVASDARGPDLSTFEAAVSRLRNSVERLREEAVLERDTRL
jgi:spore coat protein H